MTKKNKTKHPNIFSYTTKKGIKKYRVIITTNGIPIDKSGFLNINDAKAFLLNINNEIENKIKKEFNKQLNITFENYYTIYESKMLELGKWTYSTQRQKEALLNTVRPYFNNIYLSDITKEHCQYFVNQLVNRGYRKTSVNNLKNFVGTILNQAIKDELIENNKMKLVNIPVIKKTKIDKYISKEEYHTIKQYIFQNYSIQIKTFFLLCSFGLRRGEALAIKENKITFYDDNTVKIIIDDTTTPYNRDGVGYTKTKTNRFIIGNEELSNLLKECINSTKIIYSNNKKYYSTNSNIIANQNAETYSTQSIHTLFLKISKIINIKITPHKLRHYFATQGQLTGLNPRLISDFLGHKNISMTDNYSHQTEDGTRLITEKIKL